MATPVVRIPRVLNRFRLDYRYAERIPIPSVKAITVAAQTETGTWADTTLEVRKVSGTGSYAFASAKTIAAGGGSVSISSSELEGVGEIEIVSKPNGAAWAAANTFATVAVTFEQEVSVPADLPAGFIPREDPGASSLPGTPPIDF
jgi:hypothetical protein